MRILLGLRHQEALHEVVIRPMRRDGQEHPPDHAGPKGVWLVDVERRVEEGELARGCRLLHGAHHPSGQGVRHRHEADERAEEVHEHLDGVRPDGGDDAALLGVEDHGEAEGEDAPPFVDARRHRQNEGRGMEADAVAQGSGEQEDSRRGGAHGPSEALLKDLVRGEDLAAEVRGQEEERNDEAADYVAEDELQEREVSGVGRAGRTDESERARLGRDDAGGDGPPGHALPPEEVAADAAAVTSSEPRAEGRDRDDVGEENEDGREGELQATENMSDERLGAPYGFSPVATGRSGSELHSLHEPA